MATILPSISSCERRMTQGERRLAQRLESKLEDDYLCWYDVPIGARQLHPDFIILHPGRGLLILEVKDWLLETIRAVNRHSFEIHTNTMPKHVANPMAQARLNAFAVKNLLEQDAALCAPDGPHQGKLAVPYGYGVVLTRITRKQFDANQLGEVLDPDRVVCSDEMTETVDAGSFQERLWRMQSAPFVRLLSMPQVERIRWHLFPEIRIEQARLDLEETAPRSMTPTTVPDLIRVMDLQQEQLARSLGDGHRVIHGVAGSGKTLILGYRCVRLAEILDKPILVLSYNITLAAKLAHVIAQQDLEEKVTVRNFHGWCHDQLRLYGVPKPEPGADFYDEMVDAVIRGVDRGHIPRAQYGAVMIDEGHDFRPEWLKLVVQMVDPATNSLLVLYDDAQSIYAKRVHRKFSFKSVGIEAQGRTTILKLNYRNTAEVLGIAYEFAREVLTPEAAEEDGVPLIEPASAGRRGSRPEFATLPSLKAECRHIADRLRALHGKGRSWSEMAVVYRAHFVGEEITNALREKNIPMDWLTKQRRHYDPGNDSVKVLTMHSSKGLEFPVVAIPGIGFMPYERESPEDEARLLYVAMTRAMEQLFLTCHKDSSFAVRLGRLCRGQAA